MAMLDWIGLAVLLLSMLVGALRGLVFEIVSMLGWVLAFVVAQVFSADLAAQLPFGAHDATWRYPVAFVLIFVVTAFACGIAATLVRRLIVVTGLRPVDRTLGAAFGLVRALLVVLLLAVVVHVLALNGNDWWREAHLSGWADGALRDLKPTLPEKLAGYLP